MQMMILKIQKTNEFVPVHEYLGRKVCYNVVDSDEEDELMLIKVGTGEKCRQVV